MYQADTCETNLYLEHQQMRRNCKKYVLSVFRSSELDKKSLIKFKLVYIKNYVEYDRDLTETQITLDKDCYSTHCS